MSYSMDEAKRMLGQLREGVDEEPCEVQASEDEWDEGHYDLHLLTPTYELTPEILKTLHQVGPFGVRHLGKVRENDNRHVWLLKEQ